METNSQNDQDTDLLLAMLESIIGPGFKHSALLDALVQSQGDVDLAATTLRGEGSSRRPNSARGNDATKKRGSSGLDGWVTKPSEVGTRKKIKHDVSTSVEHDYIEISDDDEAEEGKGKSKAKSKAPVSSGQKVLVVTSLLDVLQSPRAGPSSNKITRLAPITLGTPALISQHTPNSYHTNVLSTDLACRLFYTLLDASEKGWRGTKWHINDKLVESPHLASFYTRDRPDDTNQAAGYW